MTEPLPAIIGGLDPGAYGALALFTRQPWRMVAVLQWDARKAKTARAGVSRVIAEAMAQLSVGGAVIATENVGAMPGQGLSSTHRFGVGTGTAEGILLRAGNRLIHVSPGKWKRHMGLSGQPKRASVELARIWAPGLTLRVRDHNAAEAILLAAWYALLLGHRQCRPDEAGKWGLLGG